MKMCFYDRMRFKYGLLWNLQKRRSIPTSYIATKLTLIALLLVAFLFKTYQYYTTSSDLAEVETKLSTAQYEAASAKMSLKPALSIVKTCLTEGDHPIKIGNETWLVGSYRLSK